MEMTSFAPEKLWGDQIGAPRYIKTKSIFLSLPDWNCISVGAQI